MTKKIVITGVGATSPLGGTAPESWQALLAGESGARTLEHDWVEKYELPVTFAAEAKVRPDTVLERPVAKRLDPSSQLALVSAMEAWADAGSPEVVPERLGVDYATGIGGVWTLLDAWDTLRDRGPRRVLPMTVPMLMPNAASAAISMHFEARAFARTVASACASSTESLVNAYEHLQAGLADIVIAGGSESAIHPITIASFSSMQALSRRNDSPETASRPYSVDRDGFVMGEGAGVVVLEEYEHAKARGAKIYAEVIGYGLSGDAYHITSPSEDGDGAYRCMAAALKRAGIDVSEIDYVNAHGTSTPLGDELELKAVERIVGNAAGKLSMSSTKSAIGHLLGAAGAVEAIFSILAMRDGIIPPTINLDNPSVETAIDLVPKQAKRKEVNVALSNSFGFGGTNASLILRRVS